jgi:hypothetical protein
VGADTGLAEGDRGSLERPFTLSLASNGGERDSLALGAVVLTFEAVAGLVDVSACKIGV